MSSWTPHRRLGISLPKLVVGSSLAFLVCLEVDRRVFLELSQKGRAACISFYSLDLLLTGQPLTLFTVGLPAVFALRKDC
jgi:hypothetical protein